MLQMRFLKPAQASTFIWIEAQWLDGLEMKFR